MNTNYKFPFSIKTNARVFEFYTSSPYERDMWIAGFDYVILSSNEV